MVPNITKSIPSLYAGGAPTLSGFFAGKWLRALPLAK
jgi:hypothetical protein